MSRQWDVVVVGAGAAGLAAAAVVARAGLSCVAIDRMGPGGALMNLGPLHDCPGLPEETTGPDLVAQLLDVAMSAGAELAIGEVTGIGDGPRWTVATEEESHEARALIVASGLMPGRLGVAGEDAYEGRGVAHCAACDGPLYAGQRVIVAGDGRWALQDTIDLAAIAAHVTLVGDVGAAPSGDRPQQIAALPNVATLTGGIVDLHGADGMEAVTVAHDGRREKLEARAIFVHTQRRGSTAFAGGALTLDTEGRIVADGATSVPGAPSLFAAGDVRAGSHEFLAAALEEGRRAGEAAVRYVKSLAAAA